MYLDILLNLKLAQIGLGGCPTQDQIRVGIQHENESNIHCVFIHVVNFYLELA